MNLILLIVWRHGQVLVAIARCFILSDGRLVIDTEHRGILTDDHLFSPLIMPAKSYFTSSKRTQLTSDAATGVSGQTYYEDAISNESVSDDQQGEEDELDFHRNNHAQVERRSSP